jgi:hypothetical protein
LMNLQSCCGKPTSMERFRLGRNSFYNEGVSMAPCTLKILEMPLITGA